MSNPKMLFVEGGTFMRGSTECWKDALAISQVSLSSFLIGKYPVTQRQWGAVMEENPIEIQGDDLPVTNISWKEVQKFLTKLNAQTGKQYRLPTEAEWEFAARGGNKSKGFKYAGSNILDEVAWYQDNCTQLQPIGRKEPNELGLYDMSGNVWEWCRDRYGDYPSSFQINPKGPGTGSFRVYRGGSWFGLPQHCHVAYRGFISPGRRNYFLGFRLAHDFDTF